MRVRELRLQNLIVPALFALLFAACSGTDETRAEGDGRLGSAVQDAPTPVANTENAGETADPAAGQSDGGSATTGTQDGDGSDGDDSDSDGSDAEDPQDADDAGDAAGPEDADDAEDKNADENQAGAGDTPQTGPGSATAGSADTLVPVDADDSGDDVLALQRRLDELGFAPGTPDGSYGRRTVAAVEAFQGLVDLKPTGIADAETINALITYRYDGLILHAGDEGDAVEELQQRLSDGPFDPGGVDGSYGTGTMQAVWALEKMAGIPVDGDWGPLDEMAWEQLTAGEIGAPEKEHEKRWVEVDLSQQLMKVYDPGSPVPTLVSHASSGSGIPWENEDHSGSSVTPLGDFEISRRINGWRESSLDIGRLYNPLYFNGGIALHGASSVPLYPASHGCIRLPMHVADYLPDELPNGTPVHVLK